MSYAFYVTDQNQNKVPVSILPATRSDCLETLTNHWQSDWTSEYIQREELEKYAMYVSDSHELIGLCACMPQPDNSCVRMVYMESAPLSNPTLVKSNQRKYYGIGQAFIAFSVLRCLDMGCDGTLVFKAKTTELFWHYIHDYGATPLRRTTYDLALFPENGLPILEGYKTKEET